MKAVLDRDPSGGKDVQKIFMFVVRCCLMCSTVFFIVTYDVILI